MFELPTLRPYQEELVKELRAKIVEHKSIIACLKKYHMKSHGYQGNYKSFISQHCYGV
jgi:hypothetical protein